MCPVEDGCPFADIKVGIDVPEGDYIHSFEITKRDVDRNTEYDEDFRGNPTVGIPSEGGEPGR